MRFLVNGPGAKKRRRKSSSRKRNAKGHFVSTKRKRRPAATAKRKRRRTTTKGATMARRRKRRSSARKVTTHRRRRRSPAVNSPKRRRRRSVARRTARRSHRRRGYARNPGLVSTLKGAVMDGALVVGGRAAYATANKLIPFGGTTAVDLAKGLAVVVGLSMVANKALGRDRARMLAAGAASSFVAGLVTKFAPSAAGYLGDGYGVGSYGTHFGGTPGNLSVTGGDRGVSSFPGAGFGEHEGMSSYAGGGWG